MNVKKRKIIFDYYEKQFRTSGLDEDKINMCRIRNDYRKCCRNKRQKYELQKAQDLYQLSKSNAKHFWKTINRKEYRIGNCDFFTHFKNMYSIHQNDRITEHLATEGLDINLDVLDEEISLNELEKAILKLNNNKASGADGIINEFIKYSNNHIKMATLKIFNKILETGFFPQQWSIGIIVPVHKKGDLNDPLNYRGITLMSCMGKLFTNIINERLNRWAEENTLISENQFGFRKEKSTTDCLFLLQGLIEHYFNSSKQLYCSFVDLTRAFDSIDRSALWYKLSKNGISSKITKLIKNMYDKIKLCIKNNKVTSYLRSEGNHTTANVNSTEILDDDMYFTSCTGVLQGESLSPFLFSMFVNDLDQYLSDNDDFGVPLDEMILTSLLFADDMVILSNTRQGLQAGLNSLNDYCLKWGLTVNVQKSNCVAFKKGGKISKLDQWTYAGENLETLDHFKYLGFVFGSSGKFSKGINNIVNQSYKSLFALKTVLSQYPESNVKMQLHLFNTLVLPILNYGSEIWGFSKAEKLDILYLGYMKSILGVRRSTPSAFIYKELNILPLIKIRHIKIFKYWLKVINLPANCLVKKLYNSTINDMESEQICVNWAYLVKNMLDTYGLGFIWIEQNNMSIDNKTLISLFTQRVHDINFQNVNEQISNVSKNRLYRKLYEEKFSNQYLFDIKEKYIRSSISKFRLGSHNLMIERGKWKGKELIDRECSLCGKLEDEYHVVIECPRYKELRKLYIPQHLTKRPSMLKLTQFLNTENANEITAFGKFCFRLFKYYDNNFL